MISRSERAACRRAGYDGVVIGELLAASCDDPSVLARIGGPIGEAARDAAGELVEMSVSTARTWRVRLIAAMRSPIPPGIRGVHPSWIEAGLDGRPERARAALSAASTDLVAVWLARWACAEIPPLPPIDPALTTARTLAELTRLSSAALVGWLANAGADQLAFALRSKPDALQAIARTHGAEGDRIGDSTADGYVGGLGLEYRLKAPLLGEAALWGEQSQDKLETAAGDVGARLWTLGFSIGI